MSNQVVLVTGASTGYSTDTLFLLKDINAGVGSAIAHQVREDEGTQSPSETLSLRMGSCRDWATLLGEAVRILGFGARVVSGYVPDPSRTLRGSANSGATHAWAEMFLPGAGWITFDPTNRSVGGANLIPVAVARDVRLAMPLVGSVLGPADAFLDMSVQVSVEGESPTHDGISVQRRCACDDQAVMKTGGSDAGFNARRPLPPPPRICAPTGPRPPPPRG